LKSSAPDSKDLILLEINGPKAILTLNNAKIANAIDVPLQHQLIEYLETLSESKEIRTITITGKGKYFCSGMNLGDSGESLSGNNEEQHDRCASSAFDLCRSHCPQ
jgi:enoyl-CoA hydratase/carnithine racemase